MLERLREFGIFGREEGRHWTRMKLGSQGGYFEGRMKENDFGGYS